MNRVVLLLGLAGLLTACGGGTKDTSPQALPPVSAPTSPPTDAFPGPMPTSTRETPSPPSSTVPTAAPESADPKGAETATDFARSWLGAIDRAYAAVDYRELQRLGKPTCQTCNNIIKSVQRAQSLHLHYRGGETSILDLAAPPVEENKAAVIAVLSYAVTEEVDASGQVVRTEPAVPKLTLQIELQQAGRGWIVTEAYKS